MKLQTTWANFSLLYVELHWGGSSSTPVSLLGFATAVSKQENSRTKSKSKISGSCD